MIYSFSKSVIVTPEDMDIVQVHFGKQAKQVQLNECCRNLRGHLRSAEFFKTHPDLKHNDAVIYECMCGRKHRRVAGEFEIFGASNG